MNNVAHRKMWILILIWILGACSNASPASAPTKPVFNTPEASSTERTSSETQGDPCELASKAEVESILGSPIKTPQNEQQDADQAICSYSLVSNTTSQADIYVNPHFFHGNPSAKDNFAQQIDSVKKTSKSAEIQGFENAAYNETLGWILVIKGDIGLDIIVNNVAGDKRKQIAESIATIVLKKLP